jgi:hypothetical protein
MVDPSLNFSLSFTFPKGNRIISILMIDRSESVHVQKVELDPEAPKEVLLDY